MSVVRLNINEYDIHEDVDSLDSVIDKIAQVIKSIPTSGYKIISSSRKLELIFIYFSSYYIPFTQILK